MTANSNYKTTKVRNKPDLKIAYLINQYPKVSHSFVRREILALEDLGLIINRYSIRPSSVTELVDNEDIEEHGKTSVLLEYGINVFIAAATDEFVTGMRNFLKAMWLATLMGRKNQRGVLRHWVYLIEACLLKQKLAKAY